MTKLVKLKPFGALAEFRNGLNFPETSRGSGDLAVIGVGNFQDNERLSEFGHLEKIVRPRNFDNESLLRDGDLVFVRSNGSPDLVGRCLLLSGVGSAVSHSGFTIRARLTSSEVSPEWVAQFFATGLAKRNIRRSGGGTNITNLSQQALQELLVPVPEPGYEAPVLRAAEQLSEAVRILDTERQLKQERKRGLMRLLLAGSRPANEFKEESWPVLSIGQLCEELTERNASELGSDRVMGVIKGVGFERMRDRVRGKGDLTRYKLVPPGAFAYNPMRLNIGSIAYNNFGKTILVSPDYVVFRARPGVAEPDYINQLRWSTYWSSFMERAGAGSVRVRIYFSDLMRLKVPAPNLEEQLRIAGVLGLLDRELDQLQHLLDVTRLRKRGILTRLLTGDSPMLT